MSKLWFVTRDETEIKTWRRIVKAATEDEALEIMHNAEPEESNSFDDDCPDYSETIYKECFAIEADARHCEAFQKLITEDDRQGDVN